MDDIGLDIDAQGMADIVNQIGGDEKKEEKEEDKAKDAEKKDQDKPQ